MIPLWLLWHPDLEALHVYSYSYMLCIISYFPYLAFAHPLYIACVVIIWRHRVNQNLCVVSHLLITGSIARSTKRQYISYSEGDFEVFHPLEQRDWMKILLKFDQTSEYKRPTGAYPLHNFHKICRVYISVSRFVSFPVKIWMDLIKGLWSYGGFSVEGSSFPKYSAPPSGKTMRWTPKVLEVQECARGPLLPCQVWWGSDFSLWVGTWADPVSTQANTHANGN